MFASKKNILISKNQITQNGFKAFSTFHHRNAKDEFSSSVFPFMMAAAGVFSAALLNRADCDEVNTPEKEVKPQSEKVEHQGKKKRWGLDLPQMPWAHKMEDADEEYEKQNHWQVEQAILTTAPNVPPPITRRHHALVKVDLTTELKKFQLNSKYKYEGW